MKLFNRKNGLHDDLKIEQNREKLGTKNDF
mgnify:CR=1 FL=1